MNKLNLLKTRRAELLKAGSDIRKKIAALTDEESFVELDSYSFSKNQFYGEDAEGEGVITGYAAVNGNQCCIVAQNKNVLRGGVSKANCLKIAKCLKKAEAFKLPVIYLLDSEGVQAGEGVNVLEGTGEVLSGMTALKGIVPQISVVLGNLYGSFALIAANTDFTFMLKDSCVAYGSPLVISAGSGKNVAKEEVGGVNASAGNNITTFLVKDVAEVRDTIVKILGILPITSEILTDTSDDLNRAAENLNKKADADSVIKAVFDTDSFIETNKFCCPEVKTGLGRTGGIAVAGLVFDGGEKGVELNLNNVLKIKNFLNFASDNSLPIVTFVNTLGIEQNLETNGTQILKEIGNLMQVLSSSERLSVIYGKAIGLGYTLFASKAMGADYSYAFATAKVALFDGAASTAYFGEVREDKLEELAEKYSDENADPINAAKDGYIDNIIEPQFVRSYVISALQTLIK